MPEARANRHPPEFGEPGDSILLGVGHDPAPVARSGMDGCAVTTRRRCRARPVGGEFAAMAVAVAGTAADLFLDAQHSRALLDFQSLAAVAAVVQRRRTS